MGEFIKKTDFSSKLGMNESEIQTMVHAENAPKIDGELLKNKHWEALNTMQKKQMELKNSKFTGYFSSTSSEDSREMKNIKDAMQKVCTFMYGTVASGAAFELQFAELMDLYTNLMKHCDTYLLKKKPWTSSGKERYSMVEAISAWAKNDYSKMGERAELFEKEAGPDTIWANILASARLMEINYDNYLKNQQVGTEGAAISEVMVFGKDDNQLFFKEDRSFVPVHELYKDEYRRPVKGGGGKSIGLFDEWNLDKRNGFKKALRASISSKPVSNEDKNTVLMKEAESFNQGLIKAGISYQFDTQDLEQFEKFYNDRKKINKDMVLESCANDAKIEENSPVTTRNVATSRMAALLGISPLVVSSKSAAVIKKGDQVRNGMVMKKASGQNFTSFNKNYLEKKQHTTKLTPEIIRQMSCLQIFDTICGQIDRHYNNFFVKCNVTEPAAEAGVTATKNVELQSLQAIDNDLAFGLLTPEDMTKKIHQLPNFVDEFGDCKLAYVDKDFFTKIQTLDLQVVEYILADLLSAKEIEALKTRIKFVKAKLAKFIKRNPERLLHRIPVKRADSKETALWKEHVDDYKKLAVRLDLYGKGYCRQ